MEKFRYCLFFGALSLLLAACGGQPERKEHGSAAPPAPTAVADKDKYLTSDSFPFDWQEQIQAQMQMASEVGGQQTRRVPTIAQADLVFVTNDVRTASRDIANLTQQYRGHLSKNNVFHIPDPAQRYTQADGSVVVLTRYSYGAEMEMQIPHEQLQNFLAALSQYTTVLSSQVQTENRISDLRLQALYEQYQQHRQNASAQPAGHVAPAQSAPDTAASSEAAASAAASAPAPSAPVPVKKSHWAHQNEFELLQRLYWQKQTESATIRLKFTQPVQTDRKGEDSMQVLVEQSRPAFGSMLAPMFRQGWSGFLGVVLFFIGIWPVALGVPLLWLGWKRWRQSANAENPVLDEAFRTDDPAPPPYREPHRRQPRQRPQQRNYFDDDDDDF
ncbi:DUF4349 domain-containing protein [Conchiformibius kuhniae]|uniref:DUF4349 domain-containing protein n=1 Tax=Conchiformibius kuhniae TaxID=211502 RepID=A0ABD8B7G0_9NEIS|nr:DUF4349 domain-containing protein [Conchiformibius kuhniae]